MLDAGVIYTLTSEGVIKTVTQPAQEPCGRFNKPTAITVDQSDNVIVSDTGNRRVLLFTASGRFNRLLYDGTPSQAGGGAMGLSSAGGKGGVGGRGTWPVGVDVNQENQLLVVVKGDKTAEVVVLTYL